MSEANLPSDPSQNRVPSHSRWDNSANADQTHTADGIAETQAEDWQDWQTVDFPNAVSADAIERQSIYSSEDVPSLDWLAQATPTPSAAHLWSTGAGNSIEPPAIADLIALIQELNQCNDVLLDRVSQLEESLERSQKAQLQAEKPSQAPDTNQTSSQSTQELIAAQAEITQLSQDLEFAQQTNQRQQILIETLTGQLEGSQERVAQLERECALTQQRYSEQSHQLTQSENTSRDLHARLQRQQQYTLQFKAALEKCLEVPPPSYEVKEQVVEAIASSKDKNDPSVPQSFLPRAKRIQPWSAQPQFLGDLSDLNVGELELDEAQIDLQSQAETQDNRQFHPLAAASLDLPTVLASIIHPDSSASDESAIELPPEQPSVPSNAVTPISSQPLSYDLKKSAGWWNEAASQPKSANLAPKLPQADQTRSEIQQIDYPAASSETPVSAPISVEAVENDLHTNPTFSEESVPSQSSDAEDALWQDLARLIDVSTDDVVKVSVSDDFDSFEAIAPSPSESQPVPSLNDSAPDIPSNQPQSTSLDVEQQIAEGISIAKLLLSSAQVTAAEQSTPAPDTSDPKTSESEQKVPAAFTTHSNWPSPIVYPLRTSKKIESLAAVKLPTFPR